MRRLFWVSGLLLFSCTACLGLDSSSSKSNSNSNNSTPELTLNKFQCIPGTSQMIGSVSLEPDKQAFSYERGSQIDIHNYLFFDKSQATVTFTKLLPTNDSLIKQTTQLTKTGVARPNSTKAGVADAKPKQASVAKQPGFGCKKSAVIQWLLYLVVNKDTDGDDKLSSKDSAVLSMSDVSGQNYTELIPGIETVLNIMMKDSKQLMVIYKKDNQYEFSIIDLLKREVTLTEKIPI